MLAGLRIKPAFAGVRKQDAFILDLSAPRLRLERPSQGIHQFRDSLDQKGAVDS
jgi:hypothetical protein